MSLHFGFHHFKNGGNSSCLSHHLSGQCATLETIRHYFRSCCRVIIVYCKQNCIFFSFFGNKRGIGTSSMQRVPRQCIHGTPVPAFRCFFKAVQVATSVTPVILPLRLADINYFFFQCITLIEPNLITELNVSLKSILCLLAIPHFSLFGV